MAVGLRMKFAGVTQEQFDKLHERVTAAGPPPGLIFHASGPIDDGWGVIDFWESRAQFDALLPHIQEAIAASGIELEGPPGIKEFPVYETMLGA